MDAHGSPPSALRELSRVAVVEHRIRAVDVPRFLGISTASVAAHLREHENLMAGQTVLKADGVTGPKTRAKLRERHGY